MYKASEIIKSSRLDRQYSLIEISKATKIPLKYLDAIEAGDSINYPAEPYCSLFVKKYADFLGMDSDKIVSLFRRDYAASKNNQDNLRKTSIYLTPQFLFTAFTSITLLLMFAFLLGRFLSFNNPPKLSIDWPQNLAEGNNVRITGTTDINSTVRVNQDLVIVDPEGKFSKLVTFDSDPKTVIVESISPSGKKTISEKTY